MHTNPSRIVITDGFHITPPLELKVASTRVSYFKIGCGIENDQLLVIAIFSAIIYLMGMTSGILFLQILSTIPVFYFLFIYYIRRREFIKIRPVKAPSPSKRSVRA